MKFRKLNEAYAFSFNSEYLKVKKEYDRLRKCNDFMKDINTDIRVHYFKVVSEDSSTMRLSCTDTLVAVQEEIEALCRKNEIPVDKVEEHNTIVYRIDGDNFVVGIAPTPQGTMLQLNRG